MSVADVDRVKNRLKQFLQTLAPSESTFYTLIENCVKQFWNKHTQGHPGVGAWEETVTWLPFQVPNAQAITIITDKVMPWLRQANNYIDSNSRSYENFQELSSYVESLFAPPASGQPAPPSSNPSPPDTERATTDAVLSLRYQVRALQDQINELATRGLGNFYTTFDNFYTQRYKLDIPFLIEEITLLKQARIEDKASFDSQIATLRAEVTSFPGILARVQTLETSVATLQRPPAQPPPRTRIWPFGTEQPTLLDSRPDTHPQAHLSTLLHKMHDLHTN